MVENEKKDDDVGSEELTAVSYEAQAEKVRLLLSELSNVFKNVRLYGLKHPVSQASLEAFYNTLQKLFEAEPLAISFYQGEIVFQETNFPKESDFFASFIDELDERDVGSLTFKPALNFEELKVFVRLLTGSPEAILEQGGLASLLEQQGITNIAVSAVEPLTSPSSAKEGSGEETKEVALEAYNFALETIEDVVVDITHQRPITIWKAKRAVQKLVDCVLRDRNALLGLAALKNYDQYTYHHSVNTLVLSLALASLLPFGKVALSNLGVAALLHDVGKVKLPPDLIKKMTPLNSEEWLLLEKHPVLGAEILSSVPTLNRVAVIVAFEHHMGFDGGGYPQVQPARKPHFFSRLVGLADAYDAATSQRPYRRANTPIRIISEVIDRSGKHFDPLLVKLFVNMMGIYPVGSLVKLSTGAVGIVVFENEADLTRPTVKVFIDEQSRRIEPLLLNLSSEKDVFIASSLPYEAVSEKPI